MACLAEREERGGEERRGERGGREGVWWVIFEEESEESWRPPAKAGTPAYTVVEAEAEAEVEVVMLATLSRKAGRNILDTSTQETRARARH